MKQPITISVDEAGQYFVNKKPVTPEGEEPALVALVRPTTPTTQQPTVVLRVDASLNVQKLVNILEIGNRLKLKMVMATQAQQAANK